MGPRLVNPHSYAELSTRVSRRDVFADDTSDIISDIDRDQLLEELQELIRSSLDYDVCLGGRSHKRRKITPEPNTSLQEESTMFRLVSTFLPPQLVILDPKPPPPPVTREPGYEDNPSQAARREERAKAAAVDFDWIMKESQSGIQSPIPWRNLVTTRATSSLSSVMMIIETEQKHRKTRPPVPATQLIRHPYVESGPQSPTISPTRSMDCLYIPLDLSPSRVAPSRIKRKRKRKKHMEGLRSPPTFWSPDPAHGGKSLGYAMGYPCSMAALGEQGSMTRYARDTMRIGIHMDSLL